MTKYMNTQGAWLGITGVADDALGFSNEFRAKLHRLPVNAGQFYFALRESQIRRGGPARAIGWLRRLSTGKCTKLDSASYTEFCRKSHAVKELTSWGALGECCGT